MMDALLHTVAALLCRFAAAILPRAMGSWGRAMQFELAGIEDGRAALGFALGCLGCALGMALTQHLVERPRSWIAAIGRGSADRLNKDLLEQPRRLLVACAAGATGVGLAYMLVTEAPPNHVATNAAALLLGLLIVRAVAEIGRTGRVGPSAVSVALGLSLLWTALFGISVDGAARWISVGGMAVQPSLMLVPVLAIQFARRPDPASAAGVVVAALALGLQADGAMLGALVAGLTLLALIRTERAVLLAWAGAGCALAFAQGDVSPALAAGDRLWETSFTAHPRAAAAMFAVAALMLLPAIAGRLGEGEDRAAYAVFGAVWLAVIAAAALGSHPMPFAGYGGSVIIGYVVSLLGLPRHEAQVPRRLGEAPRKAAPDVGDRRPNVRLLPAAN